MSITYSIQDTTLTNLGDAVRTVWGTEDTFTPAQMANSINEIGPGININVNNIMNQHINPLTNRWQRPSEWPDIDALADEIIGDQDCVYFTYDLSVHEDFHYLGLYVTMSQGDKWYLDRYDEGNFVHTHFEVDKSGYLRYDLTEEPDNSQVQLWRLTSNGHISNYSFVSWTTASGSTNISGAYQPCVDRSGTLPWYSTLKTTANPSGLIPYTSGASVTRWLEHDSLVIGKNANITSLASYWSYASRLASIDLSKWDTENWNVTSLANCWTSCYSLKELNLNYWNTENWNVTAFSSCWSNCISLENLECNQWNTENWSVTSLNSTWSLCLSLKKLNLNNWNTENWQVNTMSSAWSGCNSLVELKINQWNTENWGITSLSSCWSNCYSLKKLDLNNWNTENWAVTSLNSTWSSCYNLTSLKIASWDTSNWAVTNFGSTWSECRKLEKCEIENWDVSKWNPTSLSSTWSYCWTLKKLDLSKWDTSDWDALSSLSYTWNSCFSLQELKISSLLEQGCPISTISNAWAYCTSLKKLDLNDWDVTTWTISSLENVWQGCRNLKELNIDEWDTSNWTLTNINSFISECYSLKEINLGDWDASNWTLSSLGLSSLYSLKTIIFPKNLNYSSFKQGISFSGTTSLQSISNISQCVAHSYSINTLTSTCLKGILNDLPTISSTKTITLSNFNLAKLTAADIAVATSKGWTVV